MIIPSHLQEEFKWWLNIFSNPRQSNKIRSGNFVREIFTDASLSGWGASCMELRTHGLWLASERFLHINVLELKAAFNGSSVALRQIFETATFYFVSIISRPWHILTNSARYNSLIFRL